MQLFLFALSQVLCSFQWKLIFFLCAENQLLKSKLKCEIRTKPHERLLLLRHGRDLDDNLKDVISVVTFKTFQRWLRENKGRSRQPRKRRGRPRTKAEIEALVVRIALETGLGCGMLREELRKLGIKIAKTTVYNILKRNGIDPAPIRNTSKWKDFIKRHIQTLYAVDFFTQDVWTSKGKISYFVLLFLEISSRRIYYTEMTPNPNAQWVIQQARNIRILLEEEGKTPSYIIKDRDTKFTKGFDHIFQQMGINIIKLPRRSPNLNAYAESCIGTIKKECLKKFICLGEKHFRYILKEYINYYNTVRPHTSLGRTITPIPIRTHGKIYCQERLGGVIKHYYRKTA